MLKESAEELRPDARRSGRVTRVHVFLSIFDSVFIPVLQDLERMIGPFEVTATAWHPEVERRLLASGLPVQRVYRLWETLDQGRNGSEVPDPASLVELDRLLAPRTVWETIVAENRANASWSRARVLQTVGAHWRAITAIYGEFPPDFLLMDSIACLASYLHWGLAHARGIPVLQVVASRTPGHVYITQDEFGLVDELPQRYDQLRSGGLTSDQATRASEFVEQFRAAELRPTVSTLRTKSERPRVELRDAIRLLRHARLYAQQRERYVLYGSPVDAVVSRLRRIVRDHRGRGLFEQPDPRERFVLYPLHFEPEAATLVSAPYFRDQAALIEQLATALPVDHRLYVKEHRISIGRRPLDFYRRIAAHHNVRLIDPFVDSFRLVRRSAAVATITGTMGWEALLYQKPVLTVGNVFYNEFPGVWHVGAPEQLPEAFRQLLAAPRADRQDLLCFVAAYLDCQYPGEFQHPDDVPLVRSTENTSKIADAVRRRWLRIATEEQHAGVP
jgi:hypothetical protein